MLEQFPSALSKEYSRKCEVLFLMFEYLLYYYSFKQNNSASRQNAENDVRSVVIPNTFSHIKWRIRCFFPPHQYPHK